jgi:hypothetical protein
MVIDADFNELFHVFNEKCSTWENYVIIINLMVVNLMAVKLNCNKI